jgi:hypothetical protein
MYCSTENAKLLSERLKVMTEISDILALRYNINCTAINSNQIQTNGEHKNI